MSIKNLFHKIGDEFAILSGKLPHDWVTATNDLLAGVEKAKAALESPLAVTVAGLFPKGVGCIILADLQRLIVTVLPTLEIAQGCEQAINGITDPAQKADAIIVYLLGNVAKLPKAWQEKHWFDVAETILTTLLGISLNEAKLLLVAKMNNV